MQTSKAVQDYEPPLPGSTSQDVCCAWIMFALALFGLFVVSLVNA